MIRFKLDFVADRHDPLGGLDLVKEDFACATSPLMVIAERHAKGCIVSVSKGRYDLRATPARSPGMSSRRWERETSQLHTLIACPDWANQFAASSTGAQRYDRHAPYNYAYSASKISMAPRHLPFCAAIEHCRYSEFATNCLLRYQRLIPVILDPKRPRNRLYWVNETIPA